MGYNTLILANLFFSVDTEYEYLSATPSCTPTFALNQNDIEKDKLPVEQEVS